MESRAIRHTTLLSMVVGTLGIGLTVAYLPDVFKVNPIVIVTLAIFAVLLELLPIHLGKALSSLLPALPVGALVLYGTGISLLLFTIAGLVPPLFQRQRTWSLNYFNAGQYVISGYVMSVVFHCFSNPDLGTQQLTLKLLAAILTSLLSYYITNHILVNVLQRVRGDFEWRIASHMFIYDATNILLALPFTLLMISLFPIHGTGKIMAPVAMLPMIGLAYTLRVYRRTRDMQVVHATFTTLASEFEPAVIYERVAKVSLRLSTGDMVVVFSVDEETRKIIPEYVYPPEMSDEFSKEGYREEDGGVVWRSIHEISPVDVPDIRRDPTVRRISHGTGRRHLSMAVLPLSAHGIVHGAIVCYGERPYAFSETLDYIHSLATQSGVLLDNARLYRELQEQSIRDAATGLYNYRFFYQSLEDRVNQALENQEAVSVVIVDLDNFKRFNDTYGHLAGDAVLRSVGQLILRHCSHDSIVARYGGEEFGIILAGDGEAAYRRMEQLREAVMAHVVDFDGYQLQGLSVSIGIASCPADSQQDRDLILKADSTMYWGAKQRGKNRTAVYSDAMDGALFVDGLTTLYTAHFVSTRVREEMNNGSRTWAAICFDLVQFESINTRFGFEVGDKVLRQIGMVVKECVRDGELACRYGGDEFLVLLSDLDEFEVGTIAARISQAIRAHRIKGPNNVILSIQSRCNFQVLTDVEQPEDLLYRVENMFLNLGKTTAAVTEA